MIAAKQYHLVDASRVDGQPLDNACRSRTAIDQVAKHDKQMVPIGGRRTVSRDSAEQFVKQIESPMDITDGIDARAIGRARAAAPLLSRSRAAAKHALQPCIHGAGA
jgi:hypothetical protein